MGRLRSFRLQRSHRRRTPLRRRPVRCGSIRNLQQRRLPYHHWSGHCLFQYRKTLLLHLHRTGRQRSLSAHVDCIRSACGTRLQRRHRRSLGHTYRNAGRQRHHDQRHYYGYKRIRRQFRTPSLHSLSPAPLGHSGNNHRPRSLRGQAQRFLCRRHQHHLFRNRLRRPHRQGNLRSLCLELLLPPRDDYPGNLQSPDQRANFQHNLRFPFRRFQRRRRSRLVESRHVQHPVRAIPTELGWRQRFRRDRRFRHPQWNPHFHGRGNPNS